MCLNYALADGVDVISASLGENATSYIDSIALGAFHAIEKGLLVSCSAGNGGPGSVLNVASWIFTVGASTIDCTFVAPVELGNGKSIQGLAINTYKMNSTYPLVKTNMTAEEDYWNYGSFDPLKPKVQDEELLEFLPQFQYGLPATFVNGDQGTAIVDYINSTSSPWALIRESKATFNSSAPILMAEFSSTGPNIITPQISKPDITAPDVSILAAWSPVAEVGYNRMANFNIISGTSMSCPHVTGGAALVKSIHPDWSPAAIKSALMTTATPLKHSLDESGLDSNSGLAAGSGQINPPRAADPGLVFNITTMDYALFLCTVGFSSIEVQLISGLQTCPTSPSTVLDLNYPSMFVTYVSTLNVSSTQTVNRTLTNVGQAAQYHASVVPPTTVDLLPFSVRRSVTPSTLSFTIINEELSFTVAIEVPSGYSDYAYGSIIWSDRTHSVRMPVGVGPQA